VDLARTPAPPYYAVIFTSLRNDGDHGYEEMADEMAALAEQQPGFLGMESARDDSGFGITVSYWESEEVIAAWKQHDRHRVAQQRGVQEWYQNFAVRVCKVERDGHVIAFATARSLVSAKPHVAQVHWRHPVVLFNGALIMDPTNNQVIRGYFLDGEMAAEAVSIGRSFGVTPFVFQMSDDGREEVQYENIHNDGERGYLQSRANDPRFRRVDAIIVAPAVRIMALSYIAPRRELERLYEALRAQFGDNLNDLGLFAAAGQRVAVANAHPDLKAMADRVVASHDENGVARYIASRTRSVLHDIRIVSPEQRHLAELIRCSREFGEETQWSSTIPVGGVHTLRQARQRLFGSQIKDALVAETADQQFVGSVGVYHYNEDGVQRNEISLLVSRLWPVSMRRRLPPFHRTALHGNGSS